MFVKDREFMYRVQKINKKLLVLSGALVFFMLILFNVFFINQSTYAAQSMSEVCLVENFEEFERAVLEVCEDKSENRSLSQRSIQDDSLSVATKFNLKRLIVRGHLEDYYGAQTVIKGYKDYVVLCYSSYLSTYHAYNQLIKNADISVMIDSTIYATADSNTSLSSQDITNNWGNEAINVDLINQYLQTNGTQEELVVVVLDSGINTSHSLFNDRFLVENGEIVGDGYYTSISHSSQYDFEDDYGHGSHVSGIIAQLTPSNVKILPIKVLDNAGEGSFLNSLLALEKINDHYSKKYNICCVNLSFGGQNDDFDTISQFNDIFEALYNKGILSVISAGNDQLDSSGYTPANCDYVITVSALKKEDNSYNFDYEYSNFGANIDISAPGTDIYSADLEGITSKSGTSMAAPYVSGAIALICLDEKYWDFSQASFNAKTIEEQLLDNVVDLGDSGWDKFYGWGMLDFRYFNLESKNNDVLSFYDGQTQLNVDDYIEFTENFDLSVSSSDDSYQIYYTTDGSTPDVNSNLYLTPIEISSSTTFKFIAFKFNNGIAISNSTLYTVEFFNPTEPIDNFFVNEYGVLTNYTGHFKNLEIPSKIDGFYVYTLGIRLFNDNEIEYLTLPDTCTKIEEYCFSGCDNLKEISLDRVVTIDAFAFENCNSLTEITLTNTTVLAAKVSSKANGHVFENCNNLEIVYMPKVVILGQNNFTNSAVKEVVIGSNFDNGDGRTIEEDITIYGYQNSSAHQYARIYRNKFVILDDFELITDLEANLQVKQHEKLTLQVEATGFNLIYQWKESSSAIENGQIIATTHSNYLEIDTSQVKESKYFVVITNWDGQQITSQICTVKVEGGTIFTLKYVIDKETYFTQNYYEGDEIQLIDEPTLEGYNFAGWFIDQTFQEEFNLIVMPNEDVTIYAKWEQQKFDIIVTYIEDGITLPSDEIELNYGDSKTLYFNLQTGYQIESILVDGIALSSEKLEDITENGLTFTNISSSHEVEVIFTKINYIVCYLLEEYNLDNIIQEYNYQDKISPPATPVKENYYYFVGWFEDENFEIAAQFDIMPAQNLVFYGKFELKEYYISATFNGGGQVLPLTQTITYPKTAIFAVEPLYGYSAIEVKVDGQSISEDKLFEVNDSDSFVFSVLEYGFSDNVSYEEHTISIEFSQKEYQIVFDFNYSNSDNIIEILKHDEKITLPQLPSREGFTFKGWYLDEDYSNKFEFEQMPAKNLTVYAKWEIDYYTIDVSAGENGSISPSGMLKVSYASDINFKILPNEGYHIKSICIDDEYLSAQSLKDALDQGITLANVKQNHTLRVEFEINRYKITLSIFGEGNLYSDQDLSKIEHGENVQLKADADFNNYDMKLYINGKLVKSNGDLLIENVTSDLNIIVKFTKKPFLKSLDGLVTILSCLLLLLTVVIVIKILRKRKKKIK